MSNKAEEYFELLSKKSDVLVRNVNDLRKGVKTLFWVLFLNAIVVVSILCFVAIWEYRLSRMRRAAEEVRQEWRDSSVDASTSFSREDERNHSDDFKSAVDLMERAGRLHEEGATTRQATDLMREVVEQWERMEK